MSIDPAKKLPAFVIHGPSADIVDHDDLTISDERATIVEKRFTCHVGILNLLFFKGKEGTYHS